MKIQNSAALIIFNNDEDMLRMQFETGQLDCYEHIYIYDGPYSYVEGLFPFLENNSTKLSDKKEWNHWLENERVTYDYRIYKDEHEKRTFAYESIDKEFIILHDTDEFYDFDETTLTDFMASDKSVGFFRCQNLYSNGCRSEKSFVSSFDTLPLKAFVFKKELVSKNEHLDYLWLVGVNQLPKDLNKQFLIPLAKGYHLTQMRSTQGQIQKFCFYSSLYATKNDIGEFLRRALGQISNLVSEDKITRSEAIYLYLSSMQHFSAVHNYDSEYFFDERFKVSDKLESIITRAINERHQSRLGEVLLFNGLPYFFYLTAKNLNKLLIINTNKLDISLKIYEYKYREPGYKSQNSITTQSNVDHDFIIANDTHGFLVELLSRDSRFPSVMGINITTN